jgi:glycosyltransferase involved in cell wall biosynthesis
MPPSDQGPPRSSILLIAHFYPPSREVAAHRAEGLAKYLARRGHMVTILTTRAFGADPADGESNPAVERAYDLQLAAARLGGNPTASDALSRSEYSGPTVVGRLAVPDGHLLAWIPFARHDAHRLFRQHRYDCVVTTSPPESTHFIGRSLKRLGAAWIADLRDGWTFEPVVKQRIWPFRLQHRVNELLERRTLPHADLITAVSEPLVADARARFGEAALVTNGFDPEKTGPASGSIAGAKPFDGLDQERLSFVYTGRLSGGTAQDARPLVAAVAELARLHPALARRVELVFAGAFSAEDVALLEADVAPARILNLGLLTHERTLALQRAADALILLTNAARTQEVPAKLYEYIATGRPILGLGATGNAAGAILADTDAGPVLPADDPDAIAAALTQLAAGELSGAGAKARERFSYPAIAERFGELVDATVARVTGPLGHAGNHRSASA